MDQLAELLGTLAFGWCITHHSHLSMLPILSAIALAGLPLEVLAIHQVRPPLASQHTPQPNRLLILSNVRCVGAATSIAASLTQQHSAHHVWT